MGFTGAERELQMLQVVHAGPEQGLGPGLGPSACSCLQLAQSVAHSLWRSRAPSACKITPNPRCGGPETGAALLHVTTGAWNGSAGWKGDTKEALATQVRSQSRALHMRFS